jgi:hypothetical protein
MLLDVQNLPDPESPLVFGIATDEGDNSVRIKVAYRDTVALFMAAIF